MKHPSCPLLSRTLSTGLGLCALSLPWLAASSQAQVVFTQNFSSSNTTSDYVASPAGPNQFDNLSNGGPTGNPTNAFAVVDGALQSTKTGATSAAINRVTPLPTAGKAASFQFALSVSNAATSQSANDLIFQVGNALSNGTNQGTGIYQQYNIDLQGGTSFNVAGLGGNFQRDANHHPGPQ